MADVYVNALTQLSAEPTSTDSVVLVNRNTNEGQIIDYNLLADKILEKLRTKIYSNLTTTSKVVTGAINELDGDVGQLDSKISNFRAFSDTSEQVYELADLPTNGLGRVRLSAASSPTGAEGFFAYISTGNSVNYRMIIASATSSDTVYRTSCQGGTWRSWVTI